MPKPRTLRKTPLLAFASMSSDQLVVVRHADVEVAVGGQDDAVGPLRDEVLDGLVVGELDARAAVGRAPGLQLVDGREDLGLAEARGGGEHQARGAGVDDDRHPVVLAQLLDQHPHPLLDEGQLVGLVHRARDVDQEDEVARRPLLVGDGTAHQADPGEAVLRIPGAAGHLDVDRERVVAGRGRVVVGEVIEQLLDPDGVLGGPRVLVEEAPDVGVAGGVDVDGEGRQRGGRHAEERVLDDPVEGLGVGRLGDRLRGDLESPP